MHHQGPASLIQDRFELAGAAAGLHGELVAFAVVHEARLDELRHEVRGDLAVDVLLLKLHDLLLQLLELGLLGAVFGVLLGGGLFVGLDLALGAATLAGHLQHVRRHTFAVYR